MTVPFTLLHRKPLSSAAFRQFHRRTAKHEYKIRVFRIHCGARTIKERPEMLHKPRRGSLLKPLIYRTLENTAFIE